MAGAPSDTTRLIALRAGEVQRIQLAAGETVVIDADPSALQTEPRGTSRYSSWKSSLP